MCNESRAQNCRFKQTRFSVLLYYNNALIAVQVRCAYEPAVQHLQKPAVSRGCAVDLSMLETLRASRLLAIIRLRHSHHPDALLNALDALADGGVRLAEITLDTPNALTAVRHYQQRPHQTMQVGVGTVTQARQVARVRSSHASFVVTPVYVPSVISAAKEAGLGVLCGALTPTEIFSAYAAGADAVKVFPASSMGANYFKQVAAPLSDIPLLAVGGVSADNAADYLAAGAVAVAAGSALVSDKLIEQQAWEELTARAKQFVDRVSVQSNSVQSDTVQPDSETSA